MSPSLYHCGQEMAVTRSKMKCPACGFGLPTPGEEGMSDKPPMHCGVHMVLVRELKCPACGYKTGDTVALAPAASAAAAVSRPGHVAPAPVAVTELVGRTWAGYQVVSRLGRGGMAIVYKAYQPALDRHVAIKLMLPQGAPDPTLAERFKQEARLIAKLRHPNIVTVLDFGEKGVSLTWSWNTSRARRSGSE